MPHITPIPPPAFVRTSPPMPVDRDPVGWADWRLRTIARHVAGPGTWRDAAFTTNDEGLRVLTFGLVRRYAEGSVVITTPILPETIDPPGQRRGPVTVAMDVTLGRDRPRP